MNFHPVGKDPETGEMFMKYHYPYTIVERIQLLQRWILVQSFCYYELDNNVASDFTYDNNAKQLAEFKRDYPAEFKRSRYVEYFKDYCSEDDNAHYTSGFDLLDKVRRADKDLYRRLHIDAMMALDAKQKYGMGGIV